jgi:outer membrane protein OmpA-like peptidoglycan-associated protein
MTSLVVVFILLLAAQVTKVAEESREPAVPESVAVAEVRQELESARLPVSTTNADPYAISVVVPETILNFEFGKSTLRPEADAFLADTMPQYAAILCGPQGTQVESFVIEGHTDDWGDDIRNMKLSQDRSFAVLARGLAVIRDRLPWAYECFQRKTSATGRGRQDLLFNAAGLPDRGKSRRVIFKLHLRHT